MKIRYFFGCAIIYIAIITAYVFYITPDKYELHNTLWFEFSITLPIALWVCLPMAVLFVLTWLFMSINLIIFKFKSMSLNRDIQKIVVQVEEQMLGNEAKDRIFANNGIKQISKILKRFYLLPNLHSSAINNEKIDTAFVAFQDIENGLEAQKLKLNPKHPLFKHNARNLIHNSDKALESLKHEFQDETIAQTLYRDTNAQAIYDKAWTTLCAEKNQKLMNKALNIHQKHLTFASILQLSILCAKGEIEIKQDVFIQIYKQTTLSEREYLTIAIEVCKNLNQDTIGFCLSIFEALSKEIETAVFAYFYMLLEVGKTQEALDLQKQYPKTDFLPISAFSALKEEGYPLLMFFDPLLYRANILKTHVAPANQ